MPRFCTIFRTALILAVGAISALVTNPVTAVSGTVTTGAPGIEPGIEAFLKGSYVEAERALNVRARTRHGPSQYYLGLIYLRGYDGRVDKALAYAWFAAGDANGHRPSRTMRRKLHAQLKVGDLPRAEQMARQFVYRFSGIKIAPAPCFRSGANDVVLTCD